MGEKMVTHTLENNNVFLYVLQKDTVKMLI